VPPADLPGAGLELFELGQEGEQAADGVGVLGVPVRVFGERGEFAPAVSLQELLGEFLHPVAVGTGLRHDSTSNHGETPA
jgi:hypothetical protein